MKIKMPFIIISGGIGICLDAIQASIDAEKRQDMVLEFKAMEPVPYLPVSLCKPGCKCQVCRNSGSPRNHFCNKRRYRT